MSIYGQDTGLARHRLNQHEMVTWTFLAHGIFQIFRFNEFMNFKKITKNKIYIFTVCLVQGVTSQELEIPPPDVLFSFNQIEGDKLLGDEIEGTIGGSPTLDRG